MTPSQIEMNQRGMEDLSNTISQIEMNQRGMEDLSNTIILQAVKDYRIAGGSINGRDSKYVIEECERFFQSELYYRLSINVCDRKGISGRSAADSFHSHYKERKKRIES